MDISTVRPKVAQLTFQVFARSVHPELFHIYKSQFIDRDNYSIRLDITSDGHVVTWTGRRTVLTEVASSSHQPLPQGRRIFSTPLRDTAKDTLQYHGCVQYRYEYALERVPAEMFWMIQRQLGDAGNSNDLVQVFDSSGRIAIGGMSFIHVDTRLKSVHVQAIHTFPDDLALVKTESTFSVPD